MRRDSSETKRKILTVCVRLFLEQGYKNTTVSQIVDEAGVARGSYFESVSYQGQNFAGVDRNDVRRTVRRGKKHCRQQAAAGFTPMRWKRRSTDTD